MKIKVCGLTDIDNIQSVVAMSPDYIGFIFYPRSKRCVQLSQQTTDFIKGLDGVKKVGVFVDASIKEIAHTIATYGLDMVQLHGNESHQFCHILNHYIPVIKAFHIDETFDFDILTSYEHACTYYLFDTATKDYGGSGRSFDWQLLKQYTSFKQFFLSGGIGLDSILQLKSVHHPALTAIDVNSCFETVPGIKDVNKIKTLLHEIRN